MTRRRDGGGGAAGPQERKAMAESIMIPGGLPFTDHLGAARATVAQAVLVDDGAVPEAGGVRHEVVGRPGFVRMLNAREEGRMVAYVSANHADAVPAWLEACYPEVPAPSPAAARCLADLVLWHEVGHAVLDAASGDHWARRAAEVWCDAFGAAMALSLGGSPAGAALGDLLHGPAAARITDDSGDGDVVSAHVHDTRGACGAALAAWRAAPWAPGLEGCLAVAGAVARALVPDPREDRPALAALLRRHHLRGRRCVVPLDEHAAAFSLEAVAAKRPTARQLADEANDHAAQGRRIMRPRRDLPGGMLASAAWDLAESDRLASDAGDRA